MSRPNSAGDRGRPLLSVLIVNFNSTDMLCECLDALESSTIAQRLETIVVDNASDDFALDAMQAKYPRVTWLPQTTNTTYTGGNNIAFAHSTADLVLMLNPDTRVEPQALERAVSHMESTPGIPALGAYLVGADGQLQRYYRRLPKLADVAVMLFEPLFRRGGQGRRFLMLNESFSEPTPVENIPGAFTLLRRSAVGAQLLDPGYFNFVSDLELCDRLNRAGQVVVFPDVRCFHHRAGAGVGTQDPIARIRLYQDFTWGVRRYFGARTGPIDEAFMTAMFVAYWLVRGGRLVLKSPRILPGALRVGIAALLGQPPEYSDPTTRQS